MRKITSTVLRIPCLLSRVLCPFLLVLFLIATSTALSSTGTAQQSTAIPPHGKLVPLFNGKDLSGFDIVLRSKGINHDTDKVFTVEDGVIHVSGNDFGGIATQREYENYYLRAEFTWGEKTYQEKIGKARDCGILYNIAALPEPGQTWPRAFEFQIQEGGTGDIWLIRGATLKVKGTPVTSDDLPHGHQYVRSVRFGAGPWQDVTGYRDPVGEVEKPHGEWNLLELVVDHDHVQYFVNGKLVNEATELNADRGKILFQTEGAETFYRNLQIAPLTYQTAPLK
jgi:Domain of Unknown Function (DUF1080)